jgi:methionyl-tRNA formyltransferase
MTKAIRIIFLGTPEFAVDSLDILVKNGFQVVAVVTVPDQPAGRGQLMQSSPVKKYAEANGLPVLQPEKLKNPEFLTELSGYHADLFVVVAFRMLPEIVWKLPELGTFNLHASLLPQYRGAAPINHAIINGEKETGLTTFFLKQEIDTGEIIFREKIEIFPDETAGELHDRMKTAGAGLVLKTVQAIQKGGLKPIDQLKLARLSGELKSAPKIFREDCRIDWSRDTMSVYNMIRGLSPYPAAFTTFTAPDGESLMMKIYRCQPVIREEAAGPAKILTDNKSYLAVSTKDGMIRFNEIQQAGKRKMKTDEFLRGFRIKTDWKVL